MDEEVKRAGQDKPAPAGPGREARSTAQAMDTAASGAGLSGELQPPSRPSGRETNQSGATRADDQSTRSRR